MKIQEIKSQSRRDFTALMVCEHCKNNQLLEGGYDDDFFHTEVIPNIKCKKCAKTSGDDYIPRATKYPDGQVV